MRLSTFRGSISWTTHYGCQTLRDRSETFRRIKKHASVSRLCDLSFPTMKPLPLQCSSLTQMKTHSITFLRVKNVTSSTKFYLWRGASTRHFNQDFNQTVSAIHCCHHLSLWSVMKMLWTGDWAPELTSEWDLWAEQVENPISCHSTSNIWMTLINVYRNWTGLE